MPHGGFKQSGYGKDLSMYALEDCTEVKHVMVSLSWLLPSSLESRPRRLPHGGRVQGPNAGRRKQSAPSGAARSANR